MALRLHEPATPDEVIGWADPSLGRVFVGGDEFASDDWLRHYVSADQALGHRSYERLFVRWTDSLLLYNRDVAPPAMTNYDEELRKAISRAVHLLELCMLVRRLLRDIGGEIERASLGRVVLPWSVRSRLLEPFSDVERLYRIDPPYRTVEGERLVTECFSRFGLEQLFGSTRRASELLERRLASVETQWTFVIAALAIVAGIIVDLQPWK